MGPTAPKLSYRGELFLRIKTHLTALESHSWLIFGADTTIGRALVRKLAPLSKSLLLHGEKAHSLSELAGEISATDSLEVQTIDSDRMDADSTKNLADQCRNLLATYSGIIWVSELEDGSESDYLDTDQTATHLFRHGRLPQQLLRQLANDLGQNQQGFVLNLAHRLRHKDSKTSQLFETTTAWLSSLGCALHHELKAKNVTVSTVSGATFDHDEVDDLAETALEALVNETMFVESGLDHVNSK